MPEIQKPSNLNLIWADAGGKIQPTDQKIQLGWVSEIPPYQTMNYVQNRQDQFNAHVNQHGIAAYDPNTNYIDGKSYTQGSDGEVYFCINDATGVDPVSDNGSFWVATGLNPVSGNSRSSLIGYESFSTSFTAVVNHKYFLTSPVTVTLPSVASDGDAVVVAKNPNVTATVVDASSNTYTLSTDDETVFVKTGAVWVRLDDGGTSGGSVSLNGPTLVTQGSTNSYTISDYNAFSQYTTTTSVGTFTRTGNTISLVVPNPANTTQITLTVTRDGNPTSFLVAVGAQSVATPSITYPSEGQTAVELSPTLSSSAFATVPAGQDTHQSSQWQIASNSSFATIVYDSGTTTTNKTSVTVPSGVLSLGTVYYARVKHTGAIIGASAWSATRTFTTANQSVITPTVMVTGGPTDVGETPTITTSAFAVSSGSDTHSSTDWQVVRASDSTVVWQSLGNTTNKTSIIVPAQILQVGTQYIARVRHAGAAAGKSAWAEYNFTTRSVFFVFTPESAGLPYGGGYYAGANIVVDGVTYALIVAPKTMGGESNEVLQLLSNTASVNLSENDGLVNTNILFAMNGGSPAASFAKSLNINGYNDWYVPSFAEGEILYRYLKPAVASNTPVSARNATIANSPYSDPNGVNPYSIPAGNQYTNTDPNQTIATLFKAGGAEAFYSAGNIYYWTPKQDVRYAGASFYGRRFNDGYFVSSFSPQTALVRAVRRVPIPT